MSRFERHDADQSPTLRSDLKAKSKRRRDRLTALASASAAPLRRRNDLVPRLSVEERAPAGLVVPARNVRRSEVAHIREIAASIAGLGFCNPVLIGRDNLVIDGVARVEAAKLLGLPRIPCVRIDHLTDAEQRIMRIASNRLAEKGA